MKNYVVIKKDGTEEDFNPDKLLDIIKAAGASESSAKVVINNIINRLFKVESKKLRRLVHKHLKKIDKKAANNYMKHYIKEHY
jgi:transcriptional regulator NrdR family protein